MKGRKRHVLVDTLGLILAVVVLPASIQDWDGAIDLLLKAQGLTGRVRHMWADSSYRGAVGWIEEHFDWTAEIVARLADQVGFAVQPKRWIVESSFAWMAHFRRLPIRWEKDAENYLAMLHFARAYITFRAANVIR